MFTNYDYAELLTSKQCSNVPIFQKLKRMPAVLEIPLLQISITINNLKPRTRKVNMHLKEKQKFVCETCKESMSTKLSWKGK